MRAKRSWLEILLSVAVNFLLSQKKKNSSHINSISNKQATKNCVKSFPTLYIYVRYVLLLKNHKSMLTRISIWHFRLGLFVFHWEIVRRLCFVAGLPLMLLICELYFVFCFSRERTATESESSSQERFALTLCFSPSLSSPFLRSNAVKASATAMANMCARYYFWGKRTSLGLLHI